MSPAQIVGRLMVARKIAGLSQAAVAARLGVTQTAVSYWESGKRDMDLASAVAYAAVVKLELGVRSAR